MLHVAAALLVLTLFPRPTSTFSPALRFSDLSSSRRLSRAVQSRTWDVTTCRLQPSVNSVSAPIDHPVEVAADELLVPVVTPVTAENADVTHGSLPKSFFLLNAVAIVWGSQHVVIKSSLETLPPSALNLGRFATSSVLFLPALAAVLVCTRVFVFSLVSHQPFTSRLLRSADKRQHQNAPGWGRVGALDGAWVCVPVGGTADYHGVSQCLLAVP